MSNTELLLSTFLESKLSFQIQINPHCTKMALCNCSCSPICGINTACASQIPGSEVIVQPAPFCINIPGPMISASPEPVAVAVNNPCASPGFYEPCGSGYGCGAYRGCGYGSRRRGCNPVCSYPYGRCGCKGGC